MSQHEENHKELMELKHDAVPGFSKYLYACIAAGILLLLLSFTGVM